MKSKARRKFVTIKKDPEPSRRLLFDRRKTAHDADHCALAKPRQGEAENNVDSSGCLVVCNDLVMLQKVSAAFNDTSAPVLYADHAYGHPDASSRTEFTGEFQAEPVLVHRLHPTPLILSNGRREIWATN